MSMNGVYSPAVSVKKGAMTGAAALVPAVAIAIDGLLSNGDLVTVASHTWPALPVAAIVGVLRGLLNFFKQRR